MKADFNYGPLQGSPYILYFLKTLFVLGQHQRKVSEVAGDSAAT